MSSDSAAQALRGVEGARGSYQRPASLAPWLRFRVHRHGLIDGRLAEGDRFDLSGALASYEQTDSMSPPFSSWSARLELDNARIFDLLEALRDNDWAEVRLGIAGEGGPLTPMQVGPLDSVRAPMDVGPGGSEHWSLRLAGRSWAKALGTAVTTLQRISERPGFTGSVLTMARWNELVDAVIGPDGALSEGTSPAEALRRVLHLLLEGQWQIPATLRRPWEQSALAEDYYLRPLVGAVPHAASVDGVPWRARSLRGKVRGTIWQLLQGFTSDPALVELWPGWWMPADGSDLLPLLHYRQRPFVGDAWASLPTVRVPMARVLSLDLGKSGDERFNLWGVAPSLGSSPSETLLWASNRGLPELDAESVRVDGIQPWIVSDAMTPQTSEFEARSVRLTRWLSSAYLDAPELLSGTAALAGTALPPTVLGSRVLLVGGDGRELLEGYCERLVTTYTVGTKGQRTLRQTLALTRGRRVTAPTKPTIVQDFEVV